MNTQITSDVLDKINDEAEKRFPLLYFTSNSKKNSNRNQARFKEGSQYGYSLATEEIEKLEKELERVKGLCETALKTVFIWKQNSDMSDAAWQHFKLENNL